MNSDKHPFKEINMFKLFCAALLTTMSLSAFAETASDSATAGSDLSDKEVAKVLLTIDEGEIDDAKLAQSRSKNADVKEFAKMMRAQHETNIKNTKALAKKIDSKPEVSELSKALKDDAKKAHKDLKAQAKKDFDKAYIDEQVKMHQTALDTLNNKLIPTAENADLKAHLEKTSATVAQHLEHAKNVQSKLE
jgi:putative membrane protein